MKDNKKTIIYSILNILIAVMFLCMQHVQITYTTSERFKDIVLMSPKNIFCNVIVIAVPFLLILLLVKRLHVAIGINAFLMYVLSVVNYHVTLFHGSPFMAGDIYTLGTAMGVMGNYSVVFDRLVIKLSVIFAAQVVMLVALWLLWFRREAVKATVKIGRVKSLCGFVASLVLIFVIYFSPVTAFPDNLCTWTWVYAMQDYGYEICLMNSFYAIQNSVTKPEGYDVDTVEMVEAEVGVDGSDTDGSSLGDEARKPDIILILNESLCDLNVYSDVPESTEIMDRLRNQEDIASGYAVCSLVGGGTNNSEYELLTSNSMNLLNLAAPFTFMDMKKANSVVTYLKEQGYYSVAMHPELPGNYNRNRAYVDMQFDNMVLGGEGYHYFNRYGNRPWLDTDNCRDLIEYYEAYGEECNDGPRMMYLLTFQNHGGFEQNDPELDTTQVGADFGDYTDDVNEYLSSIEISMKAFDEVKEYYKDYDRDVIVLMVGDHAPSFIEKLPAKAGLSENELAVASRTVPYFAWANFDMDESVFSEYASMVDLVPMLLKAAGMPMTGYYESILSLHNEIPIRTKSGQYRDAAGVTGKIEENEEYQQKVQNYFYMEYNNISKGKDYRADWYELGAK